MFLGGLLPLFHFLYLMLPPSNQGSIREDGIRNQIGVHPIRNQMGGHPTVAMEHARNTGDKFDQDFSLKPH